MRLSSLLGWLGTTFPANLHGVGMEPEPQTQEVVVPPQADAHASTAENDQESARRALAVACAALVGPEAFEVLSVIDEAELLAKWQALGVRQHTASRALQGQVLDLRANQPVWLLGLLAISSGDDTDPVGSRWVAFIRAPEDGAYAGSVHRIVLTFGEQWPAAQKVDVRFETKLEHFQINRAILTGEVVADCSDHPQWAAINLEAWGKNAQSTNAAPIDWTDPAVIAAMVERQEAAETRKKQMRDPSRSLRNHLEAAHGMLSHPLIRAPMDTSTGERRQVPAAEEQQYCAAAEKLERDRAAAIEGYRALRLNAGLFWPQVGTASSSEFGMPSPPGARGLMDTLAPKLLEALQLLRAGPARTAEAARAVSALCEEVSPGVWAFECLELAGCDALLAECDQFEESGAGAHLERPNSMNKYGIRLDDIGMEGAMTELVRQLMVPLATALFVGHPEANASTSLDMHHAFTVSYQPGKDRGLDMHIDGTSDITLNICLGRSGFVGGDLVFCGDYAEETHRRASPVVSKHHGVLPGSVVHRRGVALLHAGKRRHGAAPISDGERVNLIVWARSSSYRRSPAYMARELQAQAVAHARLEAPDKVCLSRSMDTDYAKWNDELPGGDILA